MKSGFAFLIMVISVSSFCLAQEGRENSYILICRGNEAKFSVRELRDCNEVSIRDSKRDVASFLFVAMKKDKRQELEISGNRLTEEAFEMITSHKRPRTIRIEQVMDSEGTPAEGFRELTITD